MAIEDCQGPKLDLLVLLSSSKSMESLFNQGLIMMEQTFDDACPGLCAITNALRHQVAGYTFSLANFLLCTSVSLVN